MEGGREGRNAGRKKEASQLAEPTRILNQGRLLGAEKVLHASM